MVTTSVLMDRLGPILSEATHIGYEEIHVWPAALVAGNSSIERWEESLSQDERQRAERFRFVGDRTEFVIARGILRFLIGSYLQIEPAEVQFAYTSFGKPRLHPCLGQEALRFNLSHSHRRAVYGFAYERELGIDLEYIPPDWTDFQIADQFFSQRESEQLRSLSGTAQKEAFFRCWTRKEAYIKARGEGLSLGLDQFDVSLLPAEPAALLNVRTQPREVDRWCMKEVTVGPNYAAALIAEGHDWNMKQFRILKPS
ncbi:MAG: 4'-phosphopantetheinyl transferase superfamily protein [Acidobacteria bacterium]|nr:4'-phosphopantetheinyl transferase superfamily protein [Acidobacteriota bacterium]